MPCLLLLAAPLLAESDPWKGPRAWQGVLEARASSIAPLQGSGREEHHERIEFVLVSQPHKALPVHPVKMRDCRGSYLLAFDLKEPGVREGESVVTKGGGEGRLYLDVTGEVDPAAKSMRLRFAAEPATLVATVLLSGMENGRFQTLRTVMSRKSYLSSFAVEGPVDEEGVFSGSKTFEDPSNRLQRKVEVTWSVRRVDPVVAGRIVDGSGRPLAGLKVLARTITAERARQRLPPLLLEGATDAHGRFRIPAFHSFWRIEVVGQVREGKDGPQVIAGIEREEGVVLKFEEAPAVEIALDVYRVADLPWPDLLMRRYRDDVKGYFAYVRDRVPPEQLEAALVK